MAQRVVVLTGLQGSGKTTLAEQLRAKHGFVHFDGDLWASGANPISGDYDTKLSQQTAPELTPEHKKRFTDLCTFLLKFRAAQDPSSVSDEPEMWQPFFVAFCEAIQQCRSSLAVDSPGLVVSYSIYSQSMRDFIKQSLGQNACLVVLQLPRSVAVERAALRCADQYAQMGKSVDEWKVMLGPNQAGYQDAIHVEGTIVLEDDGSSDRAQVLAKAEQALMLVSAD